MFQLVRLQEVAKPVEFTSVMKYNFPNNPKFPPIRPIC